ncbi:MAG: ABC transporter substrate-binding protein [Actinomycetota bacterium]
MLALLGALALIAVACGDDSGEDDGGSTGVGQQAEEVDSEADEEPTDGESAGDEPDPEPAEEDPVENFDSATGVTADTIRVGITVPDFEALQAAGLPNYQGDAETAFQPFIDRINADGGIAGRMIEPVYVDFNFLDPETQDRACAELTEDHEVFIVLYGLLSSSNLCLTSLHETMVMTGVYQTEADRDASGDTVWLQLEATDEARAEILAGVVAGAGLLEGKTIAAVASGEIGGEQTGNRLKETLNELGYDVTLHVTQGDGTDPTQRDANYALLAQRMSADGVDFLFNLIGGGTSTEDFAAAGFRPERTAYTVFNIDTEASSDKTLLEGGITVGDRNDAAVWDDPEFRANCIDPILEDFPELTDEFSYLPDSDQQAAGEPLWITPARTACNHTRLLKLIGEIVGPDLNNETFRLALDELGAVELYGYGDATFSSDGKWDGLDEFYLQEYDLETDSLVIVGDPIVVDR